MHRHLFKQTDLNHAHHHHDSAAGRLMDSNPFDSEAGGKTQLCLIRSDRCALQEFSMTTVAMLIHISIELVKSPPETGL